MAEFCGGFWGVCEGSGEGNLDSLMIDFVLNLYNIVISVLLLFGLWLGKGGKTRLNWLFALMLLFNIGVLVSNAIVNAQDSLRPMLLVANFCVYSFGYIITAIFGDYIITYISTKTTVSRRIVHVIFALCAVAVLLVAISQFNHMYYHYDDNNIYQRGPVYWLSQAWAIGIVLIDMIVIIRHSKTLGWRDTVVLLLYGILPVIAMIIQIFVYGLTLLYAATTLSMFLIFVNIQAQQSERVKRELLQSRVSAALSQVQPHFLYNALTAIGALCAEDRGEAEQAIENLSGYLRDNLDSIDHPEPIPFEKEIAHVKNYFAIEEMRFGDRIRMEYDLKTQDFTIPALTVQPLVENAVRYGITKKKEGGTVRVATDETEHQIRISIADDGMGFDPAHMPDDGRSHVGIKNVRSRLALLCEGEMTIESVQGKGTVVLILLPKKRRNV